MSNIATKVTADRLPFDVLSQIFLLLVSDSVAFPTPPNEPSKILSEVCTTWRATALNSAQLWNRFTISSTLEMGHPHGELAFAKMCLSRVAASPLSVSIIGAPCSPSLLEEFIIPNCARFKHLTITLLWKDIHDFLSLELSFDLIERLTIVAYPTASQATLPNTRSSFPCLRHMAFQVFHQRGRGEPDMAFRDLDVLWMPLAKLVSLEFQPPLTIGRVHEILESCPSLESCSFLTSMKNTPVTRGQSTIRLPALKRFTIHVHSHLGDAPELLLDPLVLPALEYLKCWQGVYLYGRHDCFVSCIQRSRCDLRQLFIGPIVPSAFDLRAILVLTPNLNELGCPRGQKSTQVINSILKGECVRGLKKLYLKLTPNIEVTSRLLDMVEAQQRQAREGASGSEGVPPKIEELWLSGKQYSDNVDYSTRIQELQKNGLIVRRYEDSKYET